MGVSPIDLGVVPGLDTPAIRIASDRCYSAIVREKVSCQGGKLFRHTEPSRASSAGRGRRGPEKRRDFI
jgi:hypothetical protein